jgi:hypothetical protein
MSTVKNPTKVITGKHTVMSYLNVNEPKPRWVAAPRSTAFR